MIITQVVVISAKIIKKNNNKKKNYNINNNIYIMNSLIKKFANKIILYKYLQKSL